MVQREAASTPRHEVDILAAIIQLQISTFLIVQCAPEGFWEDVHISLYFDNVGMSL